MIFHRQAGRPAWAFAGTPLQSDLWLVKAVDRSASASKAEGIAARIDAVLSDANLSVGGRDQLYLRRETDVEYAEDDGAETYRHCGAVYRVVTDPA